MTATRTRSGSTVSLPLLALLVLFIGSALFKVDAFRQSPRFRGEDDTALFWSESSIHYRYARMIAAGDAVPALDRDVEWPDGVAPHREFTFGMEYAAGLSYRLLEPLLGGMAFHHYLVWFICLWSSLSVAAAFLAARAIWGSSLGGVVAAAAYALSAITLSRTVWNYVREDFTLPLLFGAFALFAACLAEAGADRRRATARVGALAVAAGLALALGLATWHLARFYLLAFGVLVIPLVARALAADGAARRAEASALRAALYSMVIALLAAGALVPVLRAKRFLLSPGFLVLATLLIAFELLRRRRRDGDGAPPTFRQPLLIAGLAGASLAVVLLARLLPGAEGEYSHVSGLLQAKLRFLGQKPADPSLLTDDARVFWVGPFQSPDAPSTLLTFSSMLVWGPLACLLSIRDAWRSRAPSSRVQALLLALFFAVAFLFIERLAVFLVFFVALLAPALLLLVDARRRSVALALLAVLALYEVYYLRSFSEANPWRNWVQSRFGEPPAEVVPNHGNNERLIAWIRRYVPPRSPILAWFPTGPTLLTDTGRPINIHSMFEASALRARERRMREALYGSEAELAALCREWESDYFLYQANLLLDTSPDSYRYMANRLTLSTTSAAYLLHFDPERLEHFTPLYQDSYYRLFRVGAAATGAASPELPYEQIFDPAPVGRVGGTFPDEAARAVIRRERELRALLERAFALEGAGRSEEAIAVYRQLLERSPDAVEARLRLAQLALDDGRLAEADSLVARALAKRPHFPELHFARGLIKEKQGAKGEAIAAYREAISISPTATAAQTHLTYLAPGKQ